MIKNKILLKDLDYIYKKFSERDKLKDSTILITGCAGFLGFYFLLFLSTYSKELRIKQVIALDNFKLGNPKWLNLLPKEVVKLIQFDVVLDDISKISGADKVDYVVHLASIASPTFYRKYPLETLDANVWGARRLYEYYKDKKLKGFLFFSSSEIYGNPDATHIPTSEEYYGNVSCLGPRACYDEAKRFGETLSYIYAQKFHMPIVIVRPFNNYGPGMKLEDKRVPADFAKAIMEDRDIVIHSDGKPTRTFCYIADAIVGYLKALTYGTFDYFNIGTEKPEITVEEFAKIYVQSGKQIKDYEGKIIFEVSNEKDYMTNNPERRCPNITKARKILRYEPEVDVKQGVRSFIEYLYLGEE